MESSQRNGSGEYNVDTFLQSLKGHQCAQADNRSNCLPLLIRNQVLIQILELSDLLFHARHLESSSQPWKSMRTRYSEEGCPTLPEMEGPKFSSRLAVFSSTAQRLER